MSNSQQIQILICVLIVLMVFARMRARQRPLWYLRLRRMVNIIGLLIFLLVAAIVFIALNKPS